MRRVLRSRGQAAAGRCRDGVLVKMERESLKGWQPAARPRAARHAASIAPSIGQRPDKIFKRRRKKPAKAGLRSQGVHAAQTPANSINHFSSSILRQPMVAAGGNVLGPHSRSRLGGLVVAPLRVHWKRRVRSATWQCTTWQAPPAACHWHVPIEPDQMWSDPLGDPNCGNTGCFQPMRIVSCGESRVLALAARTLIANELLSSRGM
jgi:hypothetical protein